MNGDHIVANDSRPDGISSFDEFCRAVVAALKQQQLVVFCGAGISRQSGLPMANELVGYILAKLDLDGHEHAHRLTSDLPFEAFIETLFRERDGTELLRMFRLGRPNTNHTLFAKLVRSGHLRMICTVNFDELIERALECEGLVSGKDYQIHHREEDFDAIDWNDSRKFRLIKIHGSAADAPAMAITLRQVAGRTLSSRRKSVVDHVFSRGEHGSVLVLGYSCSDLFDISPQIESLRDSRKRILFVEHSHRGATIERVSVRRDKNPFRAFHHGTRLVQNTDATLKTVWEACLEAPYQPPASPLEPAIWQQFIDQWYAPIESEPGRSCSVAGHLFLRLPEARAAIDYFERAVGMARGLGEYRRLSTYLHNLALAYTHIGDYRKAARCYEEARQHGGAS